MDIKLLEKDIERLINLLMLNSFFVLGSGVSRRYANTIEEAKTKIFDDIISGGVYSVEVNTCPSVLKQSLILNFSDLEVCTDPLKWLYIHTSTNEEFENLYLKNILPKIPRHCPEYEIFNYFKPMSLIFDFNHDCLSEIFIKNPKIKIFYPHNKFSYGMSNFLNSFSPIEYSYKLDLFKKEGIHPPLEETSDILTQEPYKFLESNIHKFQNINIIGYSFCDNGITLQDYYSFQIISTLAKHYQKTVNIIGPQPERLGSIFLQENISTNLMYIKWGIFSQAFIEHKLLCSKKCIYPINETSTITAHYLKKIDSLSK
ncbi:hypothetical protein SC613_01270 [Legionella pneumophila]|uniref:hypothetical protein n=1 Tax=Legionella pneumophila TaxID=446 RepID=UPI001A2C0734|nr:hypothetical protein [Legionella pneumophila]HAT8863240.1 hypothetical protein [Legionella pneumophila subsp. pneumophila]MCZ4689312.1 hypothetical protein [Legionella pneumophila]MDW9185309.1 hypothetical protein [Legionella pneumophila]HAT2053635.1 hypothetical protein [Legionella pneumophila]HAT8892818.1 hypothetical protein [Legionella pneumophila subsp. pneumophila]